MFRFYSILLVVFISLQANSSDIKVLWWNIGYNDYALPSEVNPGQTNLDDSFQTTNWGKYDIVALGEYIPKTLNPKSLQSLKRDFKFTKVVKYNDAYGKSMFIFSKTNFSTKITDLDWVNPNEDFLKQDLYRREMIKTYGDENMATFKRKYLSIKTDIQGRNFSFVFYHFNNPWVLFAKKLHIFKVMRELVSGKKNPLYHQILDLKKQVSADRDRNALEKNLVMMGDSNCPTKVLGIKASCYKLMESILPMLVDKRKETTYPARGSNMFRKVPPIKIDHAQVSRTVKGKLKVLRLRGSDHKAIELVISN